jgi:hypothetical protein
MKKPAPKFAPIELAYRLPGKGWKRTVIRSQRALDRKLFDLSDKGAETHTRPL